MSHEPQLARCPTCGVEATVRLPRFCRTCKVRMSPVGSRSAKPVGRPRELAEPANLRIDIERAQKLRLEAWAKERGLTVAEAVRRAIATLLGS